MYFNKILIVLLLTISSVTYMFAQDEELDSINFEESEEVVEERVYFALAGGYVGDFGFFNFDVLNDKLNTMGLGLAELKSTVFMQGAQGFTGLGILDIPIFKNIRIGYIGVGGAALSETVINDVTHGFNYDIGMTGLSLDYGFVPFRSLAILIGVTGGWGKIKLEAYKTSKNFDWSNIDPNSNDNNYYQSAEASMLFVRPNLYIEYAILPYLMARANIGYNFTFMNDWKFNKTAALENVPTEINGNGLALQFGIFLGMFNY